MSGSVSTAAASSLAQQPLVALRHVSKSFQAGAFALRDLSLEVAKGELLFLTGASGAGKTTLMRLLFAGERPSEGEVRVFGRDIARLSRREIPALRRRVGVVFQDFKLLPRLDVEQNVQIALDVQGIPAREARARVFTALKQVGLQQRRYQDPRSLSGGEQQRVAIARALVNEPALLLADEPTGNLDPSLTLEILELIASVAARGTTVIVATHDLALVKRQGRRTVRLDGGRVTEDVPAAGTKP